jgi:NitT/TauT family transport system permease protein
MAVHTMDAVRNLNQTYVDMAANYGATRFMIFYDVYLPGCLPRLFTGMRLCLGVSFILTIAVELISGDAGLGRMLWLAWHTFYIEKVYIAVFASGCLGFLFQKSLRALERRLIPWKGF